MVVCAPELFVEQFLPTYDAAVAHADVFRAPPALTCPELPGHLSWRTGVIRSSFMVLVASGGQRYVVALAGESEWVRNVRAPLGHVVLRDDRQRYAARLTEVQFSERAEVIRAYIHRPSPRGRPMVRTGEVA